MFRGVELLFLSLLVCFNNALGASTPKSAKALWVDSVYNSMTIEQKIGQLIVAKNDSPASLDQLINSEAHFSGACLPKGNANEILGKLNTLKNRQDVPFLAVFSQSEKFDEGFPGSIPYPSIFSKSAISDVNLLTQLERKEIEIGSRLGINVVTENNFDLDIIHGEFLFTDRNPITYAKGQELVNVRNVLLAQSHLLNSVNLNLSLFNYDFVKFIPKSVYESGEWERIKKDYSIIFFNSLDIQNGWSADKFEKEIVKGLFRNKLDYRGVLAIESDDVARQISGDIKNNAIEVELINAGFDLIVTSDPLEAYKNLLLAYHNHDIRNGDLEDRIKNILSQKYLLNHNEVYSSDVPRDYYSIINDAEISNDAYEAYAGAVTLLKNDADIIPFRHLETSTFASLMIGKDDLTTFQKTLDKYAAFTHFVLPANDINSAAFENLVKKLSSFDNVIIGLHTPFNPKVIEFLAELSHKTNLITTVFDSYLPDRISGVTKSLLVSFDDNDYTQEIVPQMIFGARPCKGIYQIKGSDYLGKGLITQPLGRLAIAKSYKCGFDESVLARIDAIADEAIRLKATPGCQVLVARNGNIIYDKSFGYYTYDSLIAVSGKTIYDVASVTKVAATTQAIMFLADRGVLDLDEKLETYLPELKGTNKGGLVIRDVLTHQSGLKAFLPLWSQSLDVEKIQMPFYSDHHNNIYSNEVALGMYSSPSLKDSIYSWTIESDLRDKPRNKRFEHYDYKYSDLGFYLMYKLAERLLNQPMDEFLEQNLYEPMGMSSTTFNPLCKFNFLNMAPTEDDQYFRHVLVWGNVHDQIAAMNGGVSGHAGLFSSAEDLAKLGQMHLQGGTYGGQKYYAPESIREFTSVQFKNNRRGLGWDKPQFDADYNPASKYASAASFGHLGFTGTIIWVDPEYDLVYVFLSNRVYPHMTNNKLNELDTRTRIHDAIYESIHNFEQHLN